MPVLRKTKELPNPAPRTGMFQKDVEVLGVATFWPSS
jgi:hypothetical protein